MLQHLLHPSPLFNTKNSNVDSLCIGRLFVILVLMGQQCFSMTFFNRETNGFNFISVFTRFEARSFPTNIIFFYILKMLDTALCKLSILDSSRNNNLKDYYSENE